VKVGLQFKRRFWEEDERIFGGITYNRFADRTHRLPQHQLRQPWERRPCSAPTAWGPAAYELTAMSPQERVQAALRPRARRSIRSTSRNSRTASRSAGTACLGSTGCFGNWSDEARRATLRQTCAPSTGGSCSPESTRRIFRPGRKARYCRRSTPSRGFTRRSSPWEARRHDRPNLLPGIHRHPP